ncbi:MAG: hypothetical protein JW932_10295 [Deltaproteobacteria bacterium]|nr:hypothetical protein [Deltaproteobacteria bacterium]
MDKISSVWDILFFNRPTRMVEISGCILAITAIDMGSVTKKAVRRNVFNFLEESNR